MSCLCLIWVGVNMPVNSLWMLPPFEKQYGSILGFRKRGFRWPWLKVHSLQGAGYKWSSLGSHSLEVFKTLRVKPLSNLVWIQCWFCFEQEFGLDDLLRPSELCGRGHSAVGPERLSQLSPRETQDARYTPVHTVMLARSGWSYLSMVAFMGLILGCLSLLFNIMNWCDLWQKPN